MLLGSRPYIIERDDINEQCRVLLIVMDLLKGSCERES